MNFSFKRVSASVRGCYMALTQYGNDLYFSSCDSPLHSSHFKTPVLVDDDLTVAPGLFTLNGKEQSFQVTFYDDFSIIIRGNQPLVLMYNQPNSGYNASNAVLENGRIRVCDNAGDCFL